LSSGTAGLKNLPASTIHSVLVAFADSFHDLFLFGIPFAVLAFITALFLKETPLKTSTHEMAKGEGLEL
jgi:hypothetical protein